MGRRKIGLLIQDREGKREGNSNDASGIVHGRFVVFVNTHMLPEIVVPAKVLSATGVRALVG